MEKTFLYIDILGFENLVTSNTDKVESIFKIIDSLHVHKDIAFQTIVFQIPFSYLIKIIDTLYILM